MTPERIAELRALAEKATPGPWKFSGADARTQGWVSSDNDTICDLWSPNGEFIAAARTALPEALDAIERVARLLDWHYHNSGTDLISSTDVFCALSGETQLYERNMTPGLRFALEGKSE